MKKFLLSLLFNLPVIMFVNNFTGWTILNYQTWIFVVLLLVMLIGNHEVYKHK